MKQNVIISIICALLIILWVYAAISKLVEFSVFEAQLMKQPLPEWSLGLFKWGLPVVELGTSILIYFQKTRFKGLVLSSVLMLLFTFYVLTAFSGAFGEIPCSCAGIISALHWKGHLVFNIIFLIISILGGYLENNSRKNHVNNLPHEFKHI